ncbi:MAG: transposase [Parcubacteria group bacterium]
MAEEKAVSLTSIAESQKIPTKEFEKQYKDHLSNYHDWDQKDHSDKWLLFKENIGKRLSIDEVSISNGELYTIITNKAAKGGHGSLVAMVEGTKASDISAILSQIPLKQRKQVEEITLDFCPSMESASILSFPGAEIVNDRFHTQQLVSDAVQELRIEERWEAIKEENEQVKIYREQKKKYRPKTYTNGDTKKQLLARSRYLLFKPNSKWTISQNQRAIILFKEFPRLEKAYHLSMMFRSFYEYSVNKKQAKLMLDRWYAKVEEKEFDSFLTTKEYIQNHEHTILNYFTNRSTNASAESFNSKLKGFRALVRGVRDRKFFLFRVSKLFG